MGFSGAFFAVPIQTFLQHAPSHGTRGKTFALNNILNFSFIFLAGAFYLLFSSLELPAWIPLIAAALFLGTAVTSQRKKALAAQKRGRIAAVRRPLLAIQWLRRLFSTHGT